jgi:hypothetical protein
LSFHAQYQERKSEKTIWFQQSRLEVQR